MRFPLLKTSLLLAFTLAASADTVNLVNGGKIEGKILSETDTELTIEVAAGGVVEERVVKKSDVLNTSKQAGDEVAWQTIKGWKLGNDSMPTAAQYDAYVGPLRSFTSQFPTSKYKADAAKLLADFEAEQKRVTNGEVKIAGKWLSKEEVQKERYQINAQVAFNFMRDQSQRDPIGALNTFDLIEKQYPGSKAWIEAAAYARKLAEAAKQQADARMTRLPNEIADRKRAVQAAAGLSKTQLQAENDRIEKADKDAMEAAQKQNLKWPPFRPNSEDSMRRISSLAENEAKRLATIDLAKPKESVQLAETARTALEKGDLTAASETLVKAREAWPNNELVQRLEKSIADAKTAASAAASTSAPAAETAPADNSAPAKATPKPAAPASTREESPAPAASAAPAAEEEESSKSPFRVVITIVLAALAIAGWKAYKSIQKKSNEVIE